MNGAADDNSDNNELETAFVLNATDNADAGWGEEVDAEIGWSLEFDGAVVAQGGGVI